MLRGCRQSRLRDTVLGRLSVKGECRFLARDLMALCWYVVQNCFIADEKRVDRFKALRKIREAIVYDNNFALPGSSLRLKA